MDGVEREKVSECQSAEGLSVDVESCMYWTAYIWLLVAATDE